MSEQVKATKTETTMRADSELGDEGTRDLAAIDFLTAIDAYASARDHFGVEDDPQVTLAKCWIALEAARTELASFKRELLSIAALPEESYPSPDELTLVRRYMAIRASARELLDADRRVG